jgi:predicted MFS family arabinose efflux permease
VLGAYAPLFRAARARRLVAVSLLGRLAVGMFDLALILLAQDATGSYALAGAAVGVFGAAIAVSAPLRGRVVDRRGARAALPPFVLVNAAAIAGLPLAAESGGDWLILLLAGAAGISVPPLVPNVAVTAFAQQRGEPGAAGALLALFAASSVVGGAVYGARSWSSPPARRLVLLVGGGAATMIPLALADSLLALALLVVVAGLPSTAQWATSSLA